jgi:hypothetical protein
MDSSLAIKLYPEDDGRVVPAPEHNVHSSRHDRLAPFELVGLMVTMEDCPGMSISNRPSNPRIADENFDSRTLIGPHRTKEHEGASTEVG